MNPRGSNIGTQRGRRPRPGELDIRPGHRPVGPHGSAGVAAKQRRSGADRRSPAAATIFSEKQSADPTTEHAQTLIQAFRTAVNNHAVWLCVLAL
jgi:hypothetical protein